MNNAVSPELIDPKIREIGPKPGGAGFPSKELIERVLDAVLNLLFIENLDDLLEEIAKMTKALFPINRLVIWLAEKDGKLRKPRIALGFSEEEKNELLSVSYTDEEVDRERNISNRVGRFSWFAPAELTLQFGIDDRESVFITNMEKVKQARESPDSWHELDCLNIPFLARDGSYVGSIEIENTTDGKIPSLETIKAIEIFASLSSVAIELAELKEKELAITDAAEKRSVKISRILSFVKDMLAIRDPDKIFDEVLVILTDLFGFKSSSIILFDERENCFRYNNLSGYQPDEIRYAKSVRMPTDIMIMDKGPQYMVGPGAYFIPAEDITEDWLDYELRGDGKGEREILSDLKKQPRKHSRAWHPLDNLIFHFHDRDGRIIGLLYPDEPMDGLIPSAEIIEGISIFTFLISIALENAKNYSKTLQAKEEIELLNRLLFHDVTNQNLAMQKYLEMSIGKEVDKDKQEIFLKSALSKLNNTINLIQKVRRLSSVRSKDKTSLLRLDLVNAIRNQIPHSVNRFPKKKVKIKYKNIPENCFVFANDLIGDLFDNLISNAIKHNPRDKVEIEISIDNRHDDFSERDFWVVSVADNSQGISDDRKRGIFDITSRFGTISGRTGLGLSIVRSLVSMYGGSIWVDDRVKGNHTKGSIFSVLFPAA